MISLLVLQVTFASKGYADSDTLDIAYAAWAQSRQVRASALAAKPFKGALFLVQSFAACMFLCWCMLQYPR